MIKVSFWFCLRSSCFFMEICENYLDLSMASFVFHNSVRSKMNSPTISVLITNTARTSSLRKCCYRHCLLRPQNKTTLLRLFWGRFSAWITALTQTRCTREVFVISTLTVGLSSSERTEIIKKDTMPRC